MRPVVRSAVRVAAFTTATLLVASGLGAQQAESLHGTLPDGLTCRSCHTTDAWSPLRADMAFDHDDTGFRLDGRHELATCARCHSGLVFAQEDPETGDCAACHVDVHLGTIVRECTACHSTTSFSDLAPGVVHPADFPLEGAHLQTSCESCHTDDLGGAYSTLDRECATCHMREYLAPTLVDHRQLGFSTDCVECHSSLDFRDVAFDHFEISGGFELTGAHAGSECASCHSSAGGAVPTAPSTAQDCVACHRLEYEAEHRGSGFPTDCLSCHSDLAWSGAQFDHDFRIFSGAHANEWESCATCHTVPGDLTTFSCVVCHDHDRTKMDDEHREERGYVYESQTCLSCHPTGRS